MNLYIIRICHGFVKIDQSIKSIFFQPKGSDLPAPKTNDSKSSKFESEELRKHDSPKQFPGYGINILQADAMCSSPDKIVFTTTSSILIIKAARNK